jgi:hypothetical protein
MAIPRLPSSLMTDIVVRFLRTNKVDCLSFYGATRVDGSDDAHYAHMEEELRGIDIVVRKLVLTGYCQPGFMVALFRALRGNVHLRQISVASCGLYPNTLVRALCDLVSSCPHMAEFPEVEECYAWRPAIITDIAESLPEGAPCESLAFEGGLGSAHVAPLLHLIRKLPRLKKFNLSRARLTGADFAALCDQIIPGGMLEKFDILENDGPGSAVAGVALKNLMIRNCGPNSLGIRVDPSFFGMVHLPRGIAGAAVASQGRCFWDLDMWDQLARNTSVSDLDMVGSSGDVANYCRALGPVPIYLDLSFCGSSITSVPEEFTIEVRTEVTLDVQPFWRKVRFTMTGTAIDLLVTILESDISALRGLSLTGSKKLRLADHNNFFDGYLRLANSKNFFERNIPAQGFQQLVDTLKKNTSMYDFKIFNASHRLRCLSLEFFPLRNRIESLSSSCPSFLPMVMLHSPDAVLRRNAIFLCVKKFAGTIPSRTQEAKSRRNGSTCWPLKIPLRVASSLIGRLVARMEPFIYWFLV